MTRGTQKVVPDRRDKVVPPARVTLPVGGEATQGGELSRLPETSW